MRSPGLQRTVQSLVEEHYAALYRYAYRLSGSAADAEDLAQETFCQAHSKLAQLREPARAKAWLFSILRNGYLRRLRDSKRQNVVSLDGVAEPPGRLPEPLPEIEPEQLQQALNDLPEDFRTPIILFYFEEFSYREIAEQMELPMGTVMSRLARAKAYLRSRLVPTHAATPPSMRRATHGLSARPPALELSPRNGGPGPE